MVEVNLSCIVRHRYGWEFSDNFYRKFCLMTFFESFSMFLSFLAIPFAKKDLVLDKVR